MSDIKLFMLFSLLISFLLTSSGHPMILISLISLQTLNSCIILFLNIPSSWFSFILFLVFMGGLMVLFIYISSLASNEKFDLSMWEFSLIKLIMFMSLTSMVWFYSINNQTIKILCNSNQIFIYKMYSPTMLFIMILTMIYLLLALIIIVNITSLEEGPLRQLK